MSPSEYHEKLSWCLLLSDGWIMKNCRQVLNEQGVWEERNSHRPEGLAFDCIIPKKDTHIPTGLFIDQETDRFKCSYIETTRLFPTLCNLMGLKSFCKGTYFHVQPRVP